MNNRKRRVSRKKNPRQDEYAITRYIPRADPPQRQRAPRVELCFSTYAAFTDNQVQPLPSIFFASEFSTSGFDAFILKRVAVWTEDVITATTSSSSTFSNPTAVVHHLLSDGTEVWPSYSDTAGTALGRARVGYHVPPHLSGPYLKNSTKGFCRVSSTGASKGCRVEILAIFC